MVALDTNIAIEILRGKLQLSQERQQAPYALPTVVAGELLFGAQNSGRPAKNLELYRTFIHNLPALLLDAMAAEHYAKIRLTLKQKGRPIPDNDMWIAAICRAHDVPLLTFDRHFAEVSGLQVLTP